MEEFANVPLVGEREAPETPSALSPAWEESPGARTPPVAADATEDNASSASQPGSASPVPEEGLEAQAVPVGTDGAENSASASQPGGAFPVPEEVFEAQAAPVGAEGAEDSAASQPGGAFPVSEEDLEAQAVPVAADDAEDNASEYAASNPAPSRARHLRKQRRRWLWGFLCGVAVALALAFGARIWEQRRAASVNDRFVWNFRENDEASESRENLGVQIPSWPLGEGPVFSILREHGDFQTAQEVYRNVNPSVVTVIVGLDDDTAAVGTGVVFSADGYFVTNYHVVQGGVQCRAMLDSGRSYPALYVAGDERNDLAVLKMDASGPFPAAQFGDSERLTVGDTVYAIGNPLGVEFRGTLTNGIISAIDRDVLVDGRTMTLLQTNAALNSGNSGGPLINEYGQVIGINVVKMSSRRSTVEGLGFAIPSAFMERLVNDLLTYGESQPEPTIGVSVDFFGTEVEPNVWGIGVLKVEPDSAAEKGGVQVGDYIIAADAETVSGSRDLLRVRRRYHVGESMSLTLWRDGERVDAVITFTE